MATYSKRKIWDRWSGSMQDLYDAIVLAHDSIAGMSTDREVSCSIEIVSAGLTTETDQIDAIKAIDERDLSSIKKIYARVYPSSGSLYSSPRVSIRVDDSVPALAVEVFGQDQTRVEGLTTQLESALGRGGRRPQRFRGLWLPVVAPSLALYVFAPLGFSMARKLHLASVNGKLDAAEVVGFVSGLFVGVGLYFWIWWLLPDLELLPKGEATRIKRQSMLVIGALVTIILGLATNYLGPFVGIK